jgi:hypothetical protein
VLPVWSGWGRLLGFALFAAMQIGFNLCMDLGLFGEVMIACMLGLLPAEFWTYLGEPVIPWLTTRAKAWSHFRLAGAFENWRQRRRQKERALASLRPDTNLKRRAWAILGVVRDGAVLFLISYTLFWNISTIPGNTWYIPAKYLWIGPETGLSQGYNLFSPDPQTDDGWIVIRGTLKNGRQIDALHGTPTVTLDRPQYLSPTYGDQCWGNYILYLTVPTSEVYLAPLTQYLEREWDRDHPAPDEQIATIQFYHLHQAIGPNHTKGPLQTDLLWTQKWE